MFNSDDYEIVQNLKPVCVLDDKKPSRLFLLKNKNNNKLSLFNATKDQILLDNCTEIAVYEEDGNALACVNVGEVCGIFDIANQDYVFPAIYDKAGIIPSKECLQKDGSVTCMCELSSYGNSSLFSFSKDKDNKYKINQIVPADTYDSIQTQLFESTHSSYTSGKKVEYTDKILYIELTKDKQKGCLIFEKENNDEIKLISSIPISFEDIRPSLFDGNDNLDLSDGDTYEDNDCYLYEATPYIVGNNGKKLIHRVLVLNEDKCIEQIKKGLLIYKQNKAWGVLYKGEKLTDPKFSPLFVVDTDSDDFSKTSIKATTRAGRVHEYISDLSNWNENLIIKSYSDTQEQELFEEFMRNLLGEQDEKQ